MKRKFKGLWIPASLWLCAEVSAQEKCIIAEVDSLNADGNGCYASNRYLAEFFGVSVSRMAAIIGDLNKRGWIRVELVNGNERTIFPGAKWIAIEVEGVTESSNPPITGSNNPPLPNPVTPNIERTKIDNKASANASSGELFSATDLLSLSSPKTEADTGRKQTKAVATRLAREAQAEVILASYPRQSPNYKRDLLATVRALKRIEYPALVTAVKNYAAHVVATKTDPKFILIAANFMDRERYLEDWTVAAQNVPAPGQSSKPAPRKVAGFAERLAAQNAQRGSNEG